MRYRRVDDAPATYVVVMETGDELAGELSRFASAEGILGASFTAVGALSEVELDWFDWESKEYRPSVDLAEQVEIVSMIGDIAEDEGRPQLHAHLAIARSDGTVHGGHLRRGIVRPTCEIVVRETPEPLRKHHDPESGLSLIRP